MEEEFGREGGAYAGCLGDGAGFPAAPGADGKSDAGAGTGYEADEGNEGGDGVVWCAGVNFNFNTSTSVGIDIDITIGITKRLVRPRLAFQPSTPSNPNPNPYPWPGESRQRPRPKPR